MIEVLFYKIASLIFLVLTVILLFVPNVPENSASFSIVLYWQMVILTKLAGIKNG